MLQSSDIGRLELAPEALEKSFNREPIGFEHNLDTLNMFGLDSLRTLAKRYDGNDLDYMVAGGASAPDQKFRSVTTANLTPYDAIEHLTTEPVRILLKRPQDYDPQFQKLLNGLTEQLLALSAGLRADRIVRLNSAILITSARTLTPFHFDPSSGFFFQIAGEKIYHVYNPATLSEPELEEFYFRGLIDIAQVDLNRRHPEMEHVFNLSGGNGFHQPQNAPHWVETNGDISISYSLFFETLAARKINRTRGFNHYIRKTGAEPTPLGVHPRLDLLKAEAMGVWIPCRKTLSAIKTATFGK